MERTRPDLYVNTTFPAVQSQRISGAARTVDTVFSLSCWGRIIDRPDCWLVHVDARDVIIRKNDYPCLPIYRNGDYYVNEKPAIVEPFP